MNTTVDVAIVGAGPYGLSLGAYLKAANVSFRVFGVPMDTWRRHMPAGMLLKSDGFASNLADPGGQLTLEKFSSDRELPYHHTRIPVPLDTFIAYGLEFQKRFLPELDQRQVTGVRREGEGFRLELEDGAGVGARRVVLAVGITHFAYTPPEFEGLPAEFVSHSSCHRDMERFRGKRVVVVGAGASAVDLSALLHEAGALVTLVARRSAIAFNEGPGNKERTLWDRMRNPASGLGSSWSSWFFCNAPDLFRALPQQTRVNIVRKYLGPAPGWPMRERVLGKFPMHLGSKDIQASVLGKGLSVRFKDPDGKAVESVADHLILATGYRVDVRKLRFLDEGLRSSLRTVESSPALSRNFESSVSGLYFVGLAAANTFGPVLRFAFGADFTAKRLAAHLASSALAGSHAVESEPRLEEAACVAPAGAGSPGGGRS